MHILLLKLLDSTMVIKKCEVIIRYLILLKAKKWLLYVCKAKFSIVVEMK